jgi:aminopeptidase N
MLLSIVLLPTLWAFAQDETGKSSSRNTLISNHNLTVKLDPAAHLLDATDTVTLRSPGPKELTFALNKSMKVSVTSGGSALELKPGTVPDLPEQLAAYAVSVPVSASELVFTYSGEIYNPILAEMSLAHVAGDQTTGIIGDEGIYLDGGSGWYPQEEYMLASFRLEASAPDPVLLVAQGDLLGRTSADGLNSSTWRSTIPQDGLTLVGGKYVVKSRRAGGITLTTYLFAEHEQFADRILDATEKYCTFYTGLLGDFPYNRFDIVENFFQTGYGMPGYTLLGNAVLAMLGRGGYDVTGPSGIAHELMHNWWGNYVFYDSEQGNWCEGLTTYMTNYYWVETNGDPQEAMDWRKRACVRFSLYAPPDKAYPLRQFKFKEKEVDDAVGYEKCAMFFHYLRGLIGDKAFFAALKQVIKEQGGGFAVWADFEKAFETTSGQDLKAVFAEWLDEPGAPRLSAYAEREANAVILTIAQGMPYWTVKVDFTGINNEGNLAAEGTVMLGASSEAEIMISSGSEKPAFPGGITYEIDPEWQLLRYVPAEAQEPCLNAVLNEKGAIVVYPSGTDEISAELLKLVDTIRGSGNEVQVIADTEFDESMFAGHSVMILGGSSVNRAWDKLAEVVPPELFTANQKSYSFRRTVYAAPEESIIATFTNLKSPGHFVAIYHGNSVEAMARARFIFYYGWDSFVLFSAGQVADRGMSPAAVNPWRAEIPAAIEE